jgi:hypothetical protein
MRPLSLKEAASRIVDGINPLIAINEFLDEFYLAEDEDRQSKIEKEPGFTGLPREDAYFGAVAEHLARRWGLAIPSWTEDPRRFLETPYFVDGFELLKPVLLRDSPIAFRRRLIFTEAEPLRRATMQSALERQELPLP